MQRSLMADLGFHQSLLEVSEDQGRLQLYCHKYGKRCSASITAPGRGEERERRHTMPRQPADELEAGAPEPRTSLTSSRDASTQCPAKAGAGEQDLPCAAARASPEDTPGHLWPPAALTRCRNAQRVSRAVSKLGAVHPLCSDLDSRE